LKPNVLQLVGSFHQGGSERQAIQLTRLLRDSNRYHVHLACLSPEGMLRDQVDQMGFDGIPSFPLTSFYDRNAALQLRKFVTLLRSRAINVVQSHDFYTNVFCMIGAALVGVPGRVAARRETTGVRTKSQQMAEKFAYKLSHAIVANAEAVRQKLIQEGVSENKIVTIHNGLDLKRITPPTGVERAAVVASLNLPIDRPRRFVTIVANLRHSVKDHPTFLRAASRVQAVVPDSAFVIAGEGELVEPMRRLAADLGLTANAFFIGRCERVSDLLSISDVCVLSSVAEGFSNSILEYMGAGRPVVATDVGGAREAVCSGVTGFLVPPQDPEAMAHRIVELLSDPNRAAAMGENGRRVVLERFSCEAQLEQTESLYARLLAPQTGLNPHHLHSESI
jgi:L-malate glycosyltransferase